MKNRYTPLCGDGLCVLPYAFSQMGNLQMGVPSSRIKILVCETMGDHFTCGCFCKAHFFTTPIILGLFICLDGFG